MVISNTLSRDFAVHLSPQRGWAQADSAPRYLRNGQRPKAVMCALLALIHAHRTEGGTGSRKRHTGLSTRPSGTDERVALASLGAFFAGDWTAGAMRIAYIRPILEGAFRVVMHFLAELLIAVGELVLLRRLRRQRLGSPTR